MKALVAQSCPTLLEPMDSNPPGFLAISSFRGSSQPREQTQVSWTAGRFFTVSATREEGRPFQDWLIQQTDITRDPGLLCRLQQAAPPFGEFPLWLKMVASVPSSSCIRCQSQKRGNIPTLCPILKADKTFPENPEEKSPHVSLARSSNLPVGRKARLASRCEPSAQS